MKKRKNRKIKPAKKRDLKRVIEEMENAMSMEVLEGGTLDTVLCKMKKDYIKLQN